MDIDSIALFDKHLMSNFSQLKLKYEARAHEIFKDLKCDKEFSEPMSGDNNVDMNAYVDFYRAGKFDKYDLSEVSAEMPSVDAVLDFVSGLRQTRTEVTAPTDQRTTHSEAELEQEFKKLSLKDEDMIED